MKTWTLTAFIFLASALTAEAADYKKINFLSEIPVPGERNRQTSFSSHQDSGKRIIIGNTMSETDRSPAEVFKFYENFFKNPEHIPAGVTNPFNYLIENGFKNIKDFYGRTPLYLYTAPASFLNGSFAGMLWMKMCGEEAYPGGNGSTMAAIYLWGEKLPDGMRVFSLYASSNIVSQRRCETAASITGREERIKNPEGERKGGLSFEAAAKASEKAGMFFGLPPYPGAKLDVEQSASASETASRYTGENSYVYIFHTGDSPEKTAAWYMEKGYAFEWPLYDKENRVRFPLDDMTPLNFFLMGVEKREAKHAGHIRLSSVNTMGVNINITKGEDGKTKITLNDFSAPEALIGKTKEATPCGYEGEVLFRLYNPKEPWIKAHVKRECSGDMEIKIPKSGVSSEINVAYKGGKAEISADGRDYSALLKENGGDYHILDEQFLNFPSFFRTAELIDEFGRFFDPASRLRNLKQTAGIYYDYREPGKDGEDSYFSIKTPEGLALVYINGPAFGFAEESGGTQSYSYKDGKPQSMIAVSRSYTEIKFSDGGKWAFSKEAPR